jgi:recombination protein RecT
MAGEALRQKAREKASGEASTEVATNEQQKRAVSIAQFLDELAPELQRALPTGMPADRLARIALTQVRRNPDLAGCSRESFAGALMTSAELGLEPGVNGEAYLVPYKGECTLIVGYQGFAKLFWQHPMARHIDAQAVYEADDFDYAYGLNPFLVHKPARSDRGEVIYYYAVASLSSGASTFVVLTPEEVKRLRGGKVGPKGEIKDPQRWMERKTAVRQLVKMLPKSPALARAIDVDEQPGSELRAQRELMQLPPTGVDVVTGEIEPAAAKEAGEYDPTTESDYQPEPTA